MLKQLFYIFIGLSMSGSALAQTASADQNVYIDLQTGLTFSQNDFTRTWEAAPAFHLNVRVPFYTGQVEGGFRYTRFNGFAPSQTDSDFTSVFIYAGYTYPLKITSWLYLLPAIRFGNNLMIFDEAEVYTGGNGDFRFVTDRVESEFAYELALGGQFQLTEHLYIHTALSYNRTLTYYPLEVTLFSIGISYSFTQPDWIKDFIQ